MVRRSATEPDQTKYCRTVAGKAGHGDARLDKALARRLEAHLTVGPHPVGDQLEPGEVIVIVGGGPERHALGHSGKEVVIAAEGRVEQLPLTIAVSLDRILQLALEDSTVGLFGDWQGRRGDRLEPLQKCGRLGRLAVELGKAQRADLAV